jgi:hypothetical protein
MLGWILSLPSVSGTLRLWTCKSPNKGGFAPFDMFIIIRRLSSPYVPSKGSLGVEQLVVGPFRRCCLPRAGGSA